ncbi:MAG: methyltransferase domain-containing protein [Planctomycetes bacterium]|nr:methyltransferase domain-containing protein [Planctomycetota bacterium]
MASRTPSSSARWRAGSSRAAAAGARALVPGAGRAHDALALARGGWDVTAVDVVPALAEEVTAALAPHRGRFVVADALSFVDEPFDLVWEHTFFCALDPTHRAAWGAMVRRNLARDGRLVALVYPEGKPPENGGPPYGYDLEHVLAALGPGFVVRAERELPRELLGRDWVQRWAVLARREEAPDRA